MKLQGSLVDLVTQIWVRSANRSISFSEDSWLDGPYGSPTRIGQDFFQALAEKEGLRKREPARPAGLLDSFDDLGPGDTLVHPEIRRFYQETSEYALDLWSEWRGAFRPFGWLLAVLFSRRLQQLNIPLAPLDSSRGMSSRVVKLVEPESGELVHTGWVRSNPKTGRTVYVGAYSATQIPNSSAPCVKVVFPLPNGSASVFMSVQIDDDGALVLESSGERFGDPGFYFVLRDSNKSGWARYLRTFRERIRVFVDDEGELRTDHEFSIWRIPFLRLHYRMRRAAA